METQVNTRNFLRGEVNQFWSTLNSCLEPHKTEDPIRCIEIIDFIGKCRNLRHPEDTSLAHFKNPILTAMVLPYCEEAAKQKLNFSVFELLILLDIKFEFPALNKTNSIICQIMPQNIVVKDLAKEKDYAKQYGYLYHNNKSISKLFKKLGVL